MAKRVMRSNRRTQRRRGSQLKQRKKRSKLLKRTLKRRNSFRKKNTYKRRKTNMKRGGRPRTLTEVNDHYAKLIGDNLQAGPEGGGAISGGLSHAINQLNNNGNNIYVTRGHDHICKVDKVLMGKIHFHPNSTCKSFSKWRRGFDRIFENTASSSVRKITMNVNNLLSGYGFSKSVEIDGINDDGYTFYKI
jgi:hypothetical protein